MVSATGVEPAVAFVDGSFARGADGGLLVEPTMRVREVDGTRARGGGRVYAAGDACCCQGWDASPHWFQMRLWSQARAMGFLAAKAMAVHEQQSDDDDDGDDALELDGGVSFELFTHVTHLLGHKVSANRAPASDASLIGRAHRSCCSAASTRRPRALSRRKPRRRV